MSESMVQNAPAEAETQEQFFTLWTVFKRSDLHRETSDGALGAFEELVGSFAAENVTLRGIYDVSGMRAEADIMIWLHGGQAEALQAALRKIRRSELFAGTEIAWSAMGVHRDAEFSKNHWPSFARGIDPEAWICVYPFVRSYEWYLLPAEERGKMLRDHGMLGREFPQVLANTVASFALNDWEWILGLEAPNLVDLVDMMRHLRSTEARNHVREEIPFYTGRRIPAAEVSEVLR